MGERKRAPGCHVPVHVALPLSSTCIWLETKPRHPDIIILDVMLRDEDGFSLCRRLRTTSTIPVIMLTAVAGNTDRVVGLDLVPTTI